MAYQPDNDDADNENSSSTGESSFPSQDTMPLAGVGVLPISGTLTTPIGVGPGDAGMGGSGLGAPLVGGAAFYGAIVHGEASDTDNGHLADRAETALAEDGRLSPIMLSGIHVSAKNGVVLLSGTSPTHAEAEIAARICAEVSGAVSVDNQLVVP